MGSQTPCSNTQNLPRSEPTSTGMRAIMPATRSTCAANETTHKQRQQRRREFASRHAGKQTRWHAKKRTSRPILSTTEASHEQHPANPVGTHRCPPHQHVSPRRSANHAGKIKNVPSSTHGVITRPFYHQGGAMRVQTYNGTFKFAPGSLIASAAICARVLLGP